MKDFPLDELLAATDLEKIQEAVYLIFAHLNKKLKQSYVFVSLVKRSRIVLKMSDHILFAEPYHLSKLSLRTSTSNFFGSSEVSG